MSVLDWRIFLVLGVVFTIATIDNLVSGRYLFALWTLALAAVDFAIARVRRNRIAI